MDILLVGLLAGGFEPFGRDHSGAQAEGVFLRFPGQWDDESWNRSSSERGYYNLFRWQLPRLGIYSRPDPLGLRAGVHEYQYGALSPIGHFDPDGRQVLDPRLIYPIACSAAVAEEARQRGRDNGWPWAHCWASCQITKLCGGSRVAKTMGLAKELLDVPKCIAEIFSFRELDPTGNCASAFQPSDFEDNDFGISCPENQSCEDRCNDLVDSSPPPGPMYWIGIGTQWYLTF